MRELKIYPIQLTLIVHAKHQLQGARVIASRHRLHRLLLFILKLARQRDALA